MTTTKGAKGNKSVCAKLFCEFFFFALRLPVILFPTKHTKKKLILQLNAIKKIEFIADSDPQPPGR
jgi:hypothetical protein